MDRRAFIVGGVAVLAAPLTAGAQQAGKVARIGMLSQGRRPTSYSAILDAFHRQLRELGYIQGQNIVIEYRWAEGRAERLPDLAVELVGLKVDVIVAGGTPAPLAAKHATTTIPIVMAAPAPNTTRRAGTRFASPRHRSEAAAPRSRNAAGIIGIR